MHVLKLTLALAAVMLLHPCAVFSQGAHRRGGSGSVTKIPTKKLKVKPFKTRDGKTGWKVKIPGRRPLATPAVVDDTVYVGGGFGSHEFYALDAKTGKPRWALKVSDDGPTAAVVADGVVAFNTESCTLFLVDAKTGEKLWSKWLGDPLMSQPAIADGKVFMSYPSGGKHWLIALGLRTGKKVWRSAIPGDIISAPVIAGDSVYVTTFDGNVHRYNKGTGKLVWRERFLATSAPWLHAGQVFVAKRDPKAKKRPVEGIARMKRSDGKQNQPRGTWRKKAAPYLDHKVQAGTRYHKRKKAHDSSVGFSSPPPAAKLAQSRATVGRGTVRGMWEYQGSRPCVANGVLYTTQGDELVAMDPVGGKEHWSYKLEGDLRKIGGYLASPPSPAGDKLYLATSRGKVLVVGKQGGKVLGSYDVKSPVRFQPSLYAGSIYVGTTDGQVVCIHTGDPTADGWPMWGGGPTHNGG